jgi:uncharacterized delta-60 repeat protein
MEFNKNKKMLRWLPVIVLMVALAPLSCGKSGGSHPSARPPGTLDTSFGTTGIVTTAIGTVRDDAFALAIQSDGKLIAAGSSQIGINYAFTLVRYNPDGSLDTTFNNTGIVTTPIGIYNDAASALSIQSDGKLVAAGASQVGSQYTFALVRYNMDGSLDTTFNNTGIVTTDIGGSGAEAFALAIQADGKLVAAGTSYGTQATFALVRYNPDGSLDTSFNTTGIVTTPIATMDVAYALAIQSDGKLVAAGFSYNGYDAFALVRYNPDGSLDTSFNTTGKVTTFIGSFNTGVSALAIQPDGKLVAAGSSSEGQDAFTLVRYNPDGSLDTTFNTTGIVISAIGAIQDRASALTIQPDGKLVAAGFSNTGTQPEFALVRYNPNGNLDKTFYTTGIVTTAIGTVQDEAFAVAIQQDGKLVAAGSSNTGTQHEFALVRYMP